MILKLILDQVLHHIDLIVSEMFQHCQFGLRKGIRHLKIPLQQSKEKMCLDGQVYMENMYQNSFMLCMSV